MHTDLHQESTKTSQVKADLSVYHEVLDLFLRVHNEKKAYKRTLRKTLKPLEITEAEAGTKMIHGFPLIDKEVLPLDYPIMKEYFLRILHIVEERAQDEVEAIMKTMERRELFLEESIAKMIREELQGNNCNVGTFLLNETLNPVLEVYAGRYKARIRDVCWSWGYCPMCGSDPYLGIIKTKTGTRFLVCSVCSTEWAFPRIQCPFCENTDYKTLWYFVASNDDRCRVEVCNRCKRYIKTIDRRNQAPQNPLAVQNIQTLHLDVIAYDKGYSGTFFLL